MSTIIRTRSPFFIRTQQITDTTLAYFLLNLSIHKGASNSIAQCNDVYFLYTFTKKPLPGEGSVTFEISEIIHNHLEQKYNGNYTTSALEQSLWITANIFARNSSGQNIGSVNSTTYLAQEGFNRFKEGVNYVTEPSAMITGNYMQYLIGTNFVLPINNEAVGSVKTYYNQGSTHIYNVTDNGQSTQKIKYPSYSSSTNLPIKAEIYASSNATGTLLKTITYEGIDECKYPVNKITFLNRWGALQELYFFKKSITSINVKRDSFDRSIFQARVVQRTDGESGCVDNILYNQMNVNEHAKKTINSQATENVVLNSGFVNEDMNTSFEELLLSEYIWLTDSGGNIIPVNITDSSHTNKTSVNDKMINYTMNFQKSAHYINQIR